MGRYIKAQISVDSQALTQQAYAYLRQLVPNWEPQEGSLDTWMIQLMSQLAADLREFASDVPEEIFRYFGSDILLIPPKASTYSTFVATITAVDDVGHVIPAGTTFGVRKPDGEFAAFTTGQEYTIPAGSTSVANVVGIAVEPGSASNALSTDEIIALDTLPWVTTIIGVAPTSGGTDGETVDEYMDRLVDEFRLMSPRPIVPEDFSAMVQRVEGIGRGYPLNLYKADTDEPDQEKAMTVVVTDDDGLAVSSQAKADALALLESQREVNMLIYVADPQYVDIELSYTVMANAGFDASALEDSVNQALMEYVNPATWGEVISGTDRLGIFRVENTIRFFELVTVINNVPGVDYLVDLQFTSSGGTPASADLDIEPVSGIPVALPRLAEADIDATITLPTA